MNHQLRQTALCAVCFSGLLARSARADFIDGQVVDSFGIGVPGVDIDVKNLGGGGPPNIFNDGTDANGFFHTTVPNGTYRVIFNPPQPPASTSLYTTVEPVVVVGAVNMGVIVLHPGVSLTGRILNPSLLGVAGVNFDVLDAAGTNIFLLHDISDGLGNFNFASPAGRITLRLDTTTVSGQTLAPAAMSLNLAGNTVLGDINLAQGFTVNAIVRGPGNFPINGCDLDAIDVLTHVKLYTPQDNTNASGFVSVIVPAGTFDVEFCPPFALHLAAGRVANQAIAANTSLGIVNLAAGFVLSGHVATFQGLDASNANIDLKDPLTGADIPICTDVTDAAGNYALIAPAGTFTVKIKPDPAQIPALGTDVHYNLSVAGTTTMNGTLPPGFVPACFGDGSTPTPCPCANFGAAGRGCANSVSPAGGILEASGETPVNPLTGTDTVVLSASGVPSSAAALYLKGNAVDPIGALFGDGVLCTSGTLIRMRTKQSVNGVSRFPEAGDPSVSWRGQTPPGSGLVGYYQTYYRNSSAAFCPPDTFNITNLVQIVW